MMIVSSSGSCPILSLLCVRIYYTGFVLARKIERENKSVARRGSKGPIGGGIFFCLCLCLCLCLLLIDRDVYFIVVVVVVVNHALVEHAVALPKNKY